jgi:predicted phosphodiesterase
MDRPLRTRKRADVLVVGDLHFAERSLALLDDVKIEIMRITIKTKPDLIVFLGDTLDRFGNIDSMRQTEAVEFFYPFTLITKVLLLIGNHDIRNKTYFMSKYHGFAALNYYWQNITIADISCVEIIVNGHVFQGVAYCPNGMLHKGLATLEGRCETPSAIFCHQEIKGCDINNILSKAGDKWGLKEPLLICGHIHKYQRPQNNVWFPGSPHQDNFGEDPDKSISLLTFPELDDGVILNIDDVIEQRIYLNIPKKITLTMKSKKYKDWEPNENDIYRIEVYGPAKTNAKLRTIDKTKGIKNKGGKVKFTNISEDTDEVEERKPTERRILKDVIATNIKKKPHLHEIYAEVFS